MKPHSPDQITTPSSTEPFDDVRQLYVGRVREGWGKLNLKSGELVIVHVRGEILLEGTPQEGEVQTRRVRRIALYGWAVDETDETRNDIGVFSLTGPVQRVVAQFEKPGSREGVELHLHYRALRGEPSLESDVVFPPIEKLIATLRWNTEVGLGEKGGALEIALFSSQGAALFTELRLELGRVDFLRVGYDSAALPQAQIMAAAAPLSPADPSLADPSLADPCPPPTAAPDPQFETVLRTLPIKFINLSDNLNLPEEKVEAICAYQKDGVCQVWRNKGAVALVTWGGGVDHSASAQRLGKPTRTQRENMLTLSELAGVVDPNYVEVFLVDTLSASFGGGVTYAAGTADAYCLLDLGMTGNDASTPNPFLLAHELCHAIGLSHPDDPRCPGSIGSIAEPRVPDVDINTLNNLRIFTADFAVLLSPLVLETVPSQVDYFHPDPEP
jgi:hypothetical protein